MGQRNKVKDLVLRNMGTVAPQPTVVETESTESAPVTPATPVTRPSVEIGTKEGDTRATFIVSKEQVRKMKYIAMMSDRKIKDELAMALETHIAKWEKAHGEIPKL